MRSSLVAVMALVAALACAPVQAAGPASVADLAERLLGSVVNISTRQNVGGRGPSRGTTPRAPEGSPFQDFFDDFFKNAPRSGPPSSRRASSLGSGFVVDASGIIVTNNHVIADADEITVEFTDGSELKAEVLGTDKKTDIAVLQGRADQAAQGRAVRQFGRGAHRRLGDGHRQPVRAGRLGHARHHLGDQARHPVRPLRQLHPDRCLHQPGQFRRAAVQHGRAGHRHQHGDHLAVGRLDRHRFLDPFEPRRQHHRSAARVRRNASRMARRFHPARHARHRGLPRHGTAHGCARRRRHAWRSGCRRGAEGRRRHRRVRWPRDQRIAGIAARRRRHARRQGGDRGRRARRRAGGSAQLRWGAWKTASSLP